MIVATLFFIFFAFVAAHPVDPAPLEKRDMVHIPYSDHSFAFTGAVSRTAAQRAQVLNHLELVSRQFGDTNTTQQVVPLNGIGGGSYYSINITIASKNFSVIFDTGSADLWVRSSNFTCRTTAGSLKTQDYCAYGNNSLDFTSPGFTPLPAGYKFNISYVASDAIGVAGTADVSIGNITVPQSVIGVADQLVNQYGFGTIDGVFGTASAQLLTSVQALNGSFVPYKSWIYRAVESNLIAPYYSVVLNRPTFAQQQKEATDPGLGSVTFGGLPVGVTTTGINVTVPVLTYRTSRTTNATATAGYTIIGDSMTFGNTRVPLGPIVLDTGSPSLYLPRPILAAYLNEIQPLPIYNSTYDFYSLQCNATLPSLSVGIGGKQFTFDKGDLTRPMYTNRKEICYSSVLPSPASYANVSIFGVPFLSNVIATFNIETNNITLAQRAKY